MQRIRREKQVSKQTRSSQRRANELEKQPPSPQTLRAMTKRDLIRLVLELQAQSASGTSAPAVEAPSIAQASTPKPTSLVIATSVRSGQTVEFPQGDVTVIGSVSSGAEIVAGGSIHIYGTLRGRAIAGTSGDRKARIFCQSLQAELLSIDGCYRVAENFDPKLRGRPMQAYLDGLKMLMVPRDTGDGPEDRASGSHSTAAERLRHLIPFGGARTTEPELALR